MPSPRRVESARNPLVKQAAALKARRARDATGLTLIEGAREVARALAAGVAVRSLLLCPELGPEPAALDLLVRDAEAAGAEVAFLSEGAFARLTLRQGPDGVAAVAAWQARQPAALAPGPNPLILVLDGLEKPGNVGALLRTADAAGVDAVVLTGRGTDLGNPNVIRASMGSVFALPVAVADGDDARAWLRSLPVRVIAATPDAEEPHWTADYRGGTAIVVGAEDRGLAAAWLEAADRRVAIPMRSRSADSLNVAVAGAVLLFEAVRQRTA
ncbi:MAG TPA: RNA methyltransferase [Trueperaceae bacterium]|nr:RNA methyltransferase [Trueperaceae bacterium]